MIGWYRGKLIEHDYLQLVVMGLGGGLGGGRTGGWGGGVEGTWGIVWVVVFLHGLSLGFLFWSLLEQSGVWFLF